MKFNWGTGIVIFIILFVAGIGLMVYISFQQDINLVHKDYYPKGLDHQTMIEKVNNTNDLVGDMKIMLNKNFLEVAFPADFHFDEIKGNIQLYRPSDFNEDLAFDIELSDSGKQQISVDGLLQGKYVVKVDWDYEETAYYYEEAIHIK